MIGSVSFLFVSMVIMVLLNLVSSMFSLSEKTSSSFHPFECGMELIISGSKTPFYLHFFFIGVLFLLFDVELIVCIPMVFLFFEKVSGVIWFFFFSVVFFGLVFELVISSLDWKE